MLRRVQEPIDGLERSKQPPLSPEPVRDTDTGVIPPSSPDLNAVPIPRK